MADVLLPALPEIIHDLGPDILELLGKFLSQAQIEHVHPVNTTATAALRDPLSARDIAERNALSAFLVDLLKAMVAGGAQSLGMKILKEILKKFGFEWVPGLGWQKIRKSEDMIEVGRQDTSIEIGRQSAVVTEVHHPGAIVDSSGIWAGQNTERIAHEAIDGYSMTVNQIVDGAWSRSEEYAEYLRKFQ